MLGSCSRAVERASTGPELDPIAFFSGATRGSGTLSILLRSPVPIRVESKGRPLASGALLLEQIIYEGAKPPRRRRWLLARTGTTTFAGTLSDAAGPVRATLRGSQLRLAFAMPGGMVADQLLTLQPDRRTIINAMEVRRLGFTVARVDEIIRRRD